MTVPVNTTNRVVALGDGTTTVFNFAGGRTFIKNDDINVYLDGVLQTTGYTVAGAGNPSGGTVTFAAAPAVDVEVALVRITEIDQPNDYQQVTNFQSLSHEGALDKLTLIAQELDDANARSLKIPTSENPTDGKTTLPADRAGKVLFFDGNGNANALTPAEIGVAGSLGTGTPNTIFGYGANGAASNFSLSGSFSIASSVISITQLPDNIVNTAAVANGTITDAKLVTVSGAKIPTNTLNGGALINGTVNGTALINNTVTESKLSTAVISRLNDIPDLLFSSSVNASSVIISGLDHATYNSYEIECNEMNVNNLNEVVYLQFGTSAVSFATTGYKGTLNGASALAPNYEVGSDVALPIARASSDNEISFKGFIHMEPAKKPKAQILGAGSWVTQGGGSLNVAGTKTSLKIFVTTGIMTGTVTLRGYRR